MTDVRGRPHRPVQRVPAAPLVQWLRQRLAAYEADVTTPRLHHHGISPAVRMLSEDLGISDRTLYRYSRSLSANGQPTDTFRRALVQDMLETAGVRFDDIYPDIDPDIVIEPMAFCPTCEIGVNPIKARCPWCNTGTRKPPVGVTLTRPRKRLITEHQLRSMHLLHTNYRLPVSVLARQAYKRMGYKSAGACDQAIRKGWRRMGLEPLSRSAVMQAWAERREPVTIPLPAEDVEQAAWMHDECGVAVEAIARLMVGRSRYGSSESLARWLRDEFRRRGIYRYLRGQVDDDGRVAA